MDAVLLCFILVMAFVVVQSSEPCKGIYQVHFTEIRRSNIIAMKQPCKWREISATLTKHMPRAYTY